MQSKNREPNATIPAGDGSLSLGQDVFYIVNTLVPEVDMSRVIGPLDEGQLETKRHAYEQIVGQLTPDDRARHPFIVYRMTRIE